MSYNSLDNNLDVTFIADREIENYARTHPGQHINSDIETLRSMGFDRKMINKTYILLRPPNIERAIDYMTEINGIIQHNFFENRIGTSKSLCYICKKARRYHLGYVPGLYNDENEDINIKNNKVNDKKSSKESICSVCYEELSKKEKKKNTLPCGHLCCTSCWTNYLQTLISEAKVEDIKCVEPKCEQKLSEDFIMKHIKTNKQLVSKYEKFRNRALIIKDPNKKLCPQPNCESYLEKSWRTKYVKCKNGHKFCFECLRPEHGKSTCENVLEKDFLLWKKDKVVKKCPNCKIYIEKNEGCNHMTCATCKYQWCWLCEGKYEYGHYKTGKCNGHQFTKANYIDEVYKPSINSINTYSNSYYNNNINTISNNQYNNNTNNAFYYINNNNENNSNNSSRVNSNILIKRNVYFKSDEEQQNCCCSLSTIFKCCIHKVNYIKSDIDGFERLNALLIWIFGYFLFVSYQVYNTYQDKSIKFNSYKNAYLIIGILISFCLFICYEVMFTALITPFILVCLVYPFFVYKIKMFFTIGNAHYFDYNLNIINNNNNNTNNITNSNNYSSTSNNRSKKSITLKKKSKKKIKKVYFKSDEEDQNCCCSLSSIFPYCLHKVNYLKDDIDGLERCHALFIWFFGYFLFVAYQIYNASKDDFLNYSSSRNIYLFFGYLIAFCSFICYEALFTTLITPFILISLVYPFFVYRIKMFFTIGNAHYYDNYNKSKNKSNEPLISYY